MINYREDGSTEQIEATVASSEAEQSNPEASDRRGLTRRDVLSVFGTGAVGLASFLVGKPSAHAAEPTDQVHEGEDHHNDHGEHHEEVDYETKLNNALIDVDILGTVNFFWGVTNLLRGHAISKPQYAALGALLAAKYKLSNEYDRHHLVKELKDGATALAIIASTIVAAEGAEMDIDTLVEDVYGDPDAISDDEKTMLMMSLAATTSSVATTVSSATIFKDTTRRLAEGDHRLHATFVDHISNLSGYVLAGDPPFIAVGQKYGFKEGMSWQLRAAWPLVIYSTFQSNLKFQVLTAERRGISKSEAAAKALKTFFSPNHARLWAEISAKSVANIVMSAGTLGMQPQVFDRGMKLDFLKSLKSTAVAAVKLTHSPEFNHPVDHHSDGHLHSADASEITEFVDTFVQAFEARFNAEVEAGQNEVSTAEFNDALEGNDFDSAEAIARQIGSPGLLAMVDTLRDLQDDGELNQSPRQRDIDHASGLNLATIAAVPGNVFDMERVHHALGGNMADVLNVFPFQASSVPFLLRPFHATLDRLQDLDETTREAVLFVILMLFSSVADNFVACKIGLELLPNKPQIPLIASIKGGSLTAMGNMANIAQFDLKTFPLVESLKQVGMHLDDMAIAYIWTRAITEMQAMGFSYFQSPEVPASSGGHH